MNTEIIPDKFFSVDGVDYIIPDPERPFAEWTNDESTSSFIPPAHLRCIRKGNAIGPLPASSSSAEPGHTSEWRYTLPPNPVVFTPPRVAESLPLSPLPATASCPSSSFRAVPPVAPAGFSIAVPRDFDDLFRAPTNGTTIVPAYLELRLPLTDL